MAVPLEELRRRFRQGPLVLDGAMGTELERRGVCGPLPMWSAEALRTAPAVVAAIHREYAAAGADILVADTFRTNPRALRAADCTGDGLALNRLAVELARAAGDGGREILVAASVAPVEDCYHPERVPEDAILRAEHEQMAAWLAAAGPDLIWIETMNSLREARSAAQAAHGHGLPLAVSFVVRQTGDLLSGGPLEEAVDAVEPLDPLAIGLNCIPPRGLTALLPRLRRATTRTIAAYAHIDNPRPIAGWDYAESVSPAAYAEYARRWLDLGASIIGGCCGTTPAHIGAVRTVVATRAQVRT